MELCREHLRWLKFLLIMPRFGAAGACGLGLPFLLEKLLNHYGYPTTLRVYAIALVCFDRQ